MMVAEGSVDSSPCSNFNPVSMLSANTRLLALGTGADCTGEEGTDKAHYHNTGTSVWCCQSWALSSLVMVAWQTGTAW